MKQQKPKPTQPVMISVEVKVFEKLGKIVNSPQKIMDIVLAFDGPCERNNIGQGTQISFTVQYTNEQMDILSKKSGEFNYRIRGFVAQALTAYVKKPIPKKPKKKSSVSLPARIVPYTCLCGKASFSFDEVTTIFKQTFFSRSRQSAVKRERRYYRCSQSTKEAWHLTSLYQEEYEAIMKTKKEDPIP